MKLKKYIRLNYYTQVEFAEYNGIRPQQVTEWITKDFIVIDNTLYSPRRQLKEVKNETA